MEEKREYQGGVSLKILRGMGIGLVSLFFAVSLSNMIHIYGGIPIGGLFPKHASFAFLLIQLFGAVVMAPIIEEFCFRLVPIDIVRSRTDSKFFLWFAVGISTIIWGLLHGNVYNMLIVTPGGILFSWAYIRWGYMTSVIAHATHNFVIIMALFYFSLS